MSAKGYYEKRKSKKLVIILISVFGAVILALGAVLAFIVLGNEEDTAKNPVVDNIDSSGKLKYEQSAVTINPDVTGQGEDRIDNVEDGYISLSHKNKAISTDGENFDCYIMNNIDNKYDMFVNIYKDSSGEEQILLSGLIPPGSGLTHFKSEIKLDKGSYKALLVITQVEEDRKTMRDNQLLLSIDLIVE